MSIRRPFGVPLLLALLASLITLGHAQLPGCTGSTTVRGFKVYLDDFSSSHSTDQPIDLDRTEIRRNVEKQLNDSSITPLFCGGRYPRDASEIDPSLHGMFLNQVVLEVSGYPCFTSKGKARNFHKLPSYSDSP